MQAGKRTGLTPISKRLSAIVLLTLLFVIAGSISLSSSLGDQDIRLGADSGLNQPASLQPGEVWTGKAVVHNADGTVTITLAVWGEKYPDSDNPGLFKNPLQPGSFVTIVDRLGEFDMKEALPAGTALGAGNTLVWTVDPSNVTGPAPFTVEYTVELGDYLNVALTDYWYSTGFAKSTFYPAIGNPFYWTKVETTINAFTLTMNWNNGKGLNSGTITDNILGETVKFGSNRSPENQKAADAGAGHWANNAVCHGVTYWWHLEWQKGKGNKTYYFTVRDLRGPGMDIVYEVILPGAGGNITIPGGRTIVSEHYFHRTFANDNSHNPFSWEGDAIVNTLDAIAKVLPNNEPPATHGDLRIHKVLQGWYDIDWGVSADTSFNAVIQNEHGHYLVFEVQPGETPNRYTYLGSVGSKEFASVVSFSSNAPALIMDIPAGMTCIVEEILDIQTTLIDVSYSCGGAGVLIADMATSNVTVTNDYAHGVGFLEVYKLFDGFPSDWGVDDSTEFYIRVWDVDYENNLYFKSELEPDGSFWCVGNDVMGLSEPYGGVPQREILVKANEPVRFSNLWTWGKYEVREVQLEGGVWVEIPKITSQEGWDERVEWHWGVVYSDSNGARELHFDETIVVTVTNRYRHGSGRMAIHKSLTGFTEDWGVTDATLFYAAILDNGNPLIFDAAKTADGSYRCIGYMDGAVPEIEWENEDVDNYITEIPFSVDQPALLSNLHTGDEHHYLVTEIIEAQYNGKYTQTYTINNGGPVPVDGIEIQADDDITTEVTVTNDFAPGVGNLTISKVLHVGGFPGDWDVDDSTVFYAQVKCGDKVMWFKATPDMDGTYRCVGNSVDSHTGDYFGAVITKLPVRVNSPVTVANLPTCREYTVEEAYDPLESYTGYCIVTYSYDKKQFYDGESMAVTITNMFRPSEGSVTVSKEFGLGSNHADWDVDNATVFYLQIKGVAVDDYMIFKATPEMDGSYLCVGDRVNGLRDGYPGETIETIPLSVNNSVTIDGLWPGETYVIEEYFPAEAIYRNNCIASYAFNGVLARHGDNLEVTMTNAFDPAFRVKYNGNGHTGGVAPVDNNRYPKDAVVTVLDNTGGNRLIRTQHSFNGWNTEPDGSGIRYVLNDTFPMPEQEVTLYAQWMLVKSSGSGGDEPTAPPVVDQVVDDPAEEVEEKAVDRGAGSAVDPKEYFYLENGLVIGSELFVEDHIWYVRGYRNNELKPLRDITRAEIAMMFYRLLKPEYKEITFERPFTDVLSEEWCGQAINILAHYGIFKGYADGNFYPHDTITRRELATVVSRLDSSMEIGENPYSDVTPDDWAYENILAAAKKDWFVGDGSGRFRPNDNLTRAEFVAVTNRVLGRCVLLEDLPDSVHRFADLDDAHWFYADFMEAAHTHSFVKKPDGICELWAVISGTGVGAAFHE